MKSKLILMLFFALAAVSCQHKDLGEDICGTGAKTIKVVMNWEDPETEARPMRINLFSQTPGVPDYGRDNVPASGEKYINLEEGAQYKPFCYDYNASNIYFRDELNMEAFQAYFPGATRATYDTYASSAESEKTVAAPDADAFYVRTRDDIFDVVFANGEEELVLNLYPRNILREFTYRVNNLRGAENILEARGAVSGMAATFSFYANSPTDERTTILFGNTRVGYDAEGGYGYLEGEFYTFPPVPPYENRFTIELYSVANKYYSSYWNVSGQINESMTDRSAKLARDGYDILISNNPNGNGSDGDNGGGIPEVDPGGSTDPSNPGNGNGFVIGVGEWGDEVIIELK